jgi:hypothetical protein
MVARTSTHISGYRVNQALHRFVLVWSTLQRMTELGKVAWRGIDLFLRRDWHFPRTAELVALLNPLRDGRPARRCS